MSVTRLPHARRAALAALAEELKRVRWDLPAGVRELRFHPIGLPGSPPFAVDEHFAGYRTLVISPFVRGGAIRRLLRPEAGTAVLISRGEELDALPDGALEGLDVYELDPVASLSADDVEGNTGLARLTRLHAKLFVVERARLAHVFIGSANATDAGLGSNVEFLCELVGPVAALGVNALVGEEAPFRGMLTPYVASARQDVDEAGTAGRALEDLLLDIAAEVRFRSTVTRRAEGWVSRVTSDAALPHIPEGARVTIAPHNRPAETRALTPVEPIDVELPPRELAAATCAPCISRATAPPGRLRRAPSVPALHWLAGPAALPGAARPQRRHVARLQVAAAAQLHGLLDVPPGRGYRREPRRGRARGAGVGARRVALAGPRPSAVLRAARRALRFAAGPPGA